MILQNRGIARDVSVDAVESVIDEEAIDEDEAGRDSDRMTRVMRRLLDADRDD